MRKLKKELHKVKQRIKLLEKSVKALKLQEIQLASMIRKKQMEEDK